METCQICKENYKDGNNLSKHVRYGHSMSMNDYYDKYILDGKVPVCLECGGKVKYLNYGQGYRKYCSPKCKQKSNLVKEKFKNTCIERFGSTTPLGNKEIREKQKRTNLERYGCENVMHVKEFKDKMEETNIERYGHPCTLGSLEIKEKVRNTCNEKFGTNSALESKEIKDRTIKSKMDNFYNSLFNGRLKENIIPQFTREEYTGRDSQKYKFLCTTHNYIFESIIYGFCPVRCPICYPNYKSSEETDLLNYVSSIYFDKIISNDRITIFPYELDIYIPSKSLAIEYNGLYWHSEAQGKDKYYHYNKYLKCKEKGVQLIQIFEDEFKDSNKSEYIKIFLDDMLKNKITQDVIGLDIVPESYVEIDWNNVYNIPKESFIKIDNRFNIFYRTNTVTIEPEIYYNNNNKLVYGAGYSYYKVI